MFCEMEGFINGQHFKKLYEKKCGPLMKKYNLKKIELDVLFFLYSYKALDTAKDIVNYKCLSKAHVSKAVESLTEKNFIEALPAKQDRRCVHLSVTEQARPVISDIKQIISGLEPLIYKDISEEEREFYSQILDKIMRNINQILREE